MPTFSYDALRPLAVRTIQALGAPPDEAEVVGESLLQANLAGHDSHGLIRIEQYVKAVRAGDVVPGAPTQVLRETACSALLDGGWNFGAVVARRAVDLAMRKAREYATGTVSVRNSNHVGRVGEYAVMAAEAGMICLATVNNHGRGTAVAPYGGSDGRLSTNPITFACPGAERPVLVDITTSVVAEGKVRLNRNAGKPAPEGWLIDSEGRPTTDPSVLYVEPKGALLALGGLVGHKGYGLSVMVDILSGALSGAGCSQSATCRLGNALFVLVIDIEKFVPLAEFREQISILERHLKASPPAPGFSEILMPGEPELRAAERRRQAGIEIDAETWRQFTECARSLGVGVSA
jgi:uncharacterized oxidoreductase